VAAVTSFNLAEAGEIILVVVTKRHHGVAVPPTKYAMVGFRV
jgi:hypothetical protein